MKVLPAAAACAFLLAPALRAEPEPAPVTLSVLPRSVNPVPPAPGGPLRVLYFQGWGRSSYEAPDDVATLRRAFPDAELELCAWDGDDVDFWNARDEADAEGRRTGALLASWTAEQRDRAVLVGHSLGARIVVRALAALAAEGKGVRRGVLLGAALPEDDADLAAVPAASRERLVCVSARDDATLRYLYGIFGEGGRRALGLAGWRGKPPPGVAQLFLPAGWSDRVTPDEPLMEYAPVRRLFLHLAKFYLEYFADWLERERAAAARQASGASAEASAAAAAAGGESFPVGTAKSQKAR